MAARIPSDRCACRRPPGHGPRPECAASNDLPLGGKGRITPPYVIPAKAGIHRAATETPKNGSRLSPSAFAGMTNGYSGRSGAESAGVPHLDPEPVVCE